MKYLTIFIFFILFFTGCSKYENDAVFTFKDEMVTVQEFKEKYYKWINDNGFSDSSSMRKKFLYSTISDEVLYEKGIREGIEYLAENTNRIENFKKKLILEYMKKNLMSEIYGIDENTLKNYYMENQEQFKRDKLYRISAIRVRKKSLAKKIIKMTKTGENSLGLLSARYSDDKNLAATNGDWGLFSADIMDPAWKDLVVKAKLGEVIGPVEDSEKYFVILEITGFAYKRYLDFKKAYPLMVEKLIKDSGEDKWNLYQQEVVKNYGAKVNLDKLNWE